MTLRPEVDFPVVLSPVFLFQLRCRSAETLLEYLLMLFCKLNRNPIETIAAHHEGEDWTEEELEEIERFKEFVRMKRKQREKKE